MNVLTVTLNPAIDRMIRLDDLRVGRDHRALSASISYGGKGVNVARALTALGVNASSLTFPDGVTPKMRVNLTLIDQRGRVTRVLEPGLPASRVDMAQFMRNFKACVKRYRLVVFSGSLPPGMAPSFLVDLIQVAKGQGILAAVDVSGLALKAALGCGVDLIKPNRQEAEECLGFRLSSRRRVSKALHVLAGYGVRDVLVSLGQDGLAGFDGSHEIFVRSKTVVDGHAVGCGDAALAGFVMSRLAGKDLGACVSWAAACGAAAVCAEVPGGIALKDVKAFERKILLTKVLRGRHRGRPVQVMGYV